MQNKLNLHYINLGLFIVFLFLTLLIDVNPPMWKGFFDPKSYLYQSGIPLTSKEFFFTHKVEPYSPVPFTVPLIFKIAGSNPVLIIRVQQLIHWLSVLFFAYALVLIIRNKFIGLFTMLLLYLIMSWWNILGWTINILSESVQISFLLCWIASLIMLYKKKTTLSFLIHILFIILLAGTRDQWPYILLLIYIILSGYFFFIDRKFLPRVLILLGLGIGIFLIQQQSAIVGHRYRKPLINSIIFRIMKNTEHYNWFRTQGMPQADKLYNEFSWTNINIAEHQWHVFGLYTNPEYVPFRRWVDEHGSSTYKKFMLSHPLYFFLLQEKKPDLERMLSTNLFSYTDQPRGYTQYMNKCFPLFHPVFLVFIFIILVVLLFRTHEFLHFFPILLIIITTLNAFLMYNADALEVERHSVLTMISVQILGLYSMATIIDWLWGKIVINSPANIDP